MGQGMCRGQGPSSDHCGRLVLLLGAELPLAVCVESVQVVLIRLRALGPHTWARGSVPGRLGTPGSTPGPEDTQTDGVRSGSVATT